jgi:hypothetical protein
MPSENTNYFFYIYLRIPALKHANFWLIRRFLSSALSVMELKLPIPTPECQARTLFRLSLVQDELGRKTEAAYHKKMAVALRDACVEKHPKLSRFFPAPDNDDNDELIYDQMVPFWAGRNWLKWDLK